MNTNGTPRSRSRAADTARALQGAGAEVVGPCPSEEAAREALDEGALAAALVDINLGSGPSFTLAALLRERGVPFVFITGYDRARSLERACRIGGEIVIVLHHEDAIAAQIWFAGHVERSSEHGR
jgi:DNA-binding NarL/FixJ family response regulator